MSNVLCVYAHLLEDIFVFVKQKYFIVQYIYARHPSHNFFGRFTNNEHDTQTFLLKYQGPYRELECF